MTRFIQLHLLVAYPPSNLNRDDLGRPKTAKVGGTERLRVSSQSLKRAWRTSDVFQSALSGHIGTRTKRLGAETYNALVAGDIKESDARDWAAKITAVFGKPKKDNPLETETLVHVSPEERETLNALSRTLISERRPPTDEELDGLLHTQYAVDIGMFGRMIADRPECNGEAAVQVAHALGVHASAVEDDYFTAVDDLNQRDETGAGHVGEAGFASALFYQYICIDRDQLLKNLGGDETLTARALRALTETALTVGPSGKQNSFASRAYAHFALAEKGQRQPRSLSLAFLKPINGGDYGHATTTELIRVRDNMDKVYGPCADAHKQFDVLAGEGSMAELVDFVAGA
ncbi:type I-E CRISPR-associated protein Cas7/Cse4/CasC [Aromatoleum toluvorans]|uniref:Type I-E CRISPR-associated protein Cas7/Cse4/CasC n=1 Tax=Aromatoleum toluvorans TaxID=92002 RepID=A0ABX1PZ89_9RHOO|nr:type I-E CRISPR-associated protein Cas7/Cse4/CasC [Aromatoleum toluvorans]NMG44763.1 type I-E CRISPR-associated protein Cas7/Cse4/CasC [Aromatoleum toluvorans]